jgi:hypothetical protein
MQVRSRPATRTPQRTTRDRPAPASNSRLLSPKRVRRYLRELSSQHLGDPTGTVSCGVGGWEGAVGVPGNGNSGRASPVHHEHSIWRCFYSVVRGVHHPCITTSRNRAPCSAGSARALARKRLVERNSRRGGGKLAPSERRLLTGDDSQVESGSPRSACDSVAMPARRSQSPPRCPDRHDWRCNAHGRVVDGPRQQYCVSG